MPGNATARSPVQAKVDSGVRVKVPEPVKGGGGAMIAVSGAAAKLGRRKVEVSAAAQTRRRTNRLPLRS